MKTLRRYLYSEVLLAVAFVTAGFLALFFFFDFVDELRAVGRGGTRGWGLTQALGYVALSIPNHLYELLPIAVLIGTIFVMARFAQSSEFTILRTSGMGPWRALRTLLSLGLAFVFITFAVGDYLAPVTERAAQLLKARYDGRLAAGQTGAWLKERSDGLSVAINVQSLAPDGRMQDVRLFAFDDQGRLHSTVQADTGRAAVDGQWLLEGVRRTRFTGGPQGATRVERDTLPQLAWPSTLTGEMVSAALLKPDRMRAVDLFQYIRHLDANGQTAQRYEIEFWRKVFYPMSCLVMVVLALPFAYLHFRNAGIASYVFGGVMAGISFFLLNNVFGYIGNLRAWWPWLTAAAPGILYSLVSLGAFGWLVLRR